MTQSDAANNTSSFGEALANLPEPVQFRVGLDPSLFEHADRSLAHLADALVTVAADSDIPPDGLEGCQRLLWVAVQLRLESDPHDRLKYLADALELVADGFACITAQARTVVDTTDFRPKAFEHACGTSAVVIGLLRGITAQAERDRAELNRLGKAAA